MRTNNVHGILVSGCCHIVRWYDDFMNRKNIIYEAHNSSVLTLAFSISIAFHCEMNCGKQKKSCRNNSTIAVSIEN